MIIRHLYFTEDTPTVHLPVEEWKEIDADEFEAAEPFSTMTYKGRVLQIVALDRQQGKVLLHWDTLGKIVVGDTPWAN